LLLVIANALPVIIVSANKTEVPSTILRNVVMKDPFFSGPAAGRVAGQTGG